MKKKSINQKLNLKKITIAALTGSKMSGVYGGNAPLSTDYHYTQGRDEYGHCVQPRECPQTVLCPSFTIDPCLGDTFDMCQTNAINCNTGMTIIDC